MLSIRAQYVILFLLWPGSMGPQTQEWKQESFHLLPTPSDLLIKISLPVPVSLISVGLEVLVPELGVLLPGVPINILLN